MLNINVNNYIKYILTMYLFCIQLYCMLTSSILNPEIKLDYLHRFFKLYFYFLREDERWVFFDLKLPN